MDDKDDVNHWNAKECVKAIVEGILNKKIFNPKPVDPDGVVKDNTGTFQAKRSKW